MGWWVGLVSVCRLAHFFESRTISLTRPVQHSLYLPQPPLLHLLSTVHPFFPSTAGHPPAPVPSCTTPIQRGIARVVAISPPSLYLSLLSSHFLLLPPLPPPPFSVSPFSLAPPPLLSPHITHIVPLLPRYCRLPRAITLL